MQSTPKKDRIEIFMEKISAKKQKLDISVIQKNSVATKLSVKLSSTVSGWVDYKEIIVRKVNDNSFVDIDSTEDDEVSNDDFAEFFVSSLVHSSQESLAEDPLSQVVASVSTQEPMLERHPCVRVFPFRMEGFEWLASADSLEDTVTFERVLSSGKIVETSYVPIIVKPDLPEPVPNWITCTAFRENSPSGDDCCGDRAVGLSTCCSDGEVYCLGHMPHWVHTMCAEDFTEYFEKKRRDEEEYLRDPEAYQRTHAEFEFHYEDPNWKHQALCNCYCVECM